MKAYLEAKTSQFGSTDTGRDWCIKALHPADPLTEVRGVPDYQAEPTTLLNWQTQFKITPNAAATGTWSADICLMSDPSTFAWYSATDSVGTTVANCLNTQLGATLTDAAAALYANAKRWRCAYMSATIYLDAPALSNQGMVTAAQYPVVPAYSFTPSIAVGAAPSGRCAMMKVVKFSGNDVPSYDKLRVMPNAYFGEAKDGVYMPLKLEPNHVKYRGNADRWGDGIGFSYTGSGVSWPVAAGVPPSPGWPYSSGYETPVYWNTTTSTIDGSQIPGFGNDNVGGICFQNLSVNAGLTVVIRYGCEVMCNPGSIWAPYLRLAPPSDEKALSTYYAIARELKDAYPADFNDWEKLWGTIKRAASAVSPFLSYLGPAGNAIRSGGEAIGKVVDAVTGAVLKKPSPELAKDSPPAAQLERARSVIEQAPAMVAVAQAAARPKVRVKARSGGSTQKRGAVKFKKQGKKK